jgi:ATP-binding cassette subfamily F protein uup
VQRENEAAREAAKAGTMQTETPAKKKKLTYKEQKELEQIEKDLEALSAEKEQLEAQLSGGELPFDRLQAASERIGQIMEETDEKEMRWLELTDGL